MKISALLKHGPPTVSFEFFPPKTDEGTRNLMDTVASLKDLSPSFVSMTYGAGGSTRAKTVDLVSRIKHDVGLEAAAHLTCVGHSQNELKAILNELSERGIENILALRGDPPKGHKEFVAAKDGFAHASQLVRFISSNFSFSIGVAGYPEKHPEAQSMETDLDHLGEKIAAGGEFIVTQLFFNNEDYFSYVEALRDRNINTPVIAGIMPITDFDQIKRFVSMCGAKIPGYLLSQLEKADGDKGAVEQIGIEHAVAQCEDLIRKGAPGIHFYTLNKSHATREIFTHLKKRKVVG